MTTTPSDQCDLDAAWESISNGISLRDHALDVLARLPYGLWPTRLAADSSSVRVPKHEPRTPAEIATSDPETTVLTEDEVIGFLKMTNRDPRKALYRLRTRRINPLKFFRSGRDVRFRLVDVLDFLQRDANR